MSAEILNELRSAIVEMRFDDTEGLARRALEAGVQAVDVLNDACLPALDEVGVLFREGDYFLPDVLMSVKAYDSAYRLLLPGLKEGAYESRGRVMLGTVEGDIHEIGKNILHALLQGNGFDVVDLGVNVSPAVFLEKAKEHKPDIIGMSALLTTTMPVMKETIELFAKEGLKDSFRFIVGGSPLNQRFSDEIGADGYGEDAQSGVELVRRLLAS
ncbi:MAG: corrinoid protein [Spirochaetes bacterium]|jgi:5-methyltetrahydrofolate--homocysteine methyltransferase|nr:corrinoid protein [Spirochaetota bacterium]